MLIFGATSATSRALMIVWPLIWVMILFCRAHFTTFDFTWCNLLSDIVLAAHFGIIMANEEKTTASLAELVLFCFNHYFFLVSRGNCDLFILCVYCLFIFLSIIYLLFIVICIKTLDMNKRHNFDSVFEKPGQVTLTLVICLLTPIYFMFFSYYQLQEAQLLFGPGLTGLSSSFSQI